ncbi:SpoIIE family protein phosphatase [Klenkia brasiliensis]|uniref:Stage II sporulation protein E (SpoIIE) n=1 Tax=Klenkia brasiliensis TaxID=333142 RepID=A0A1G7PBK1_9ACTN|nr:SpoIIE family protein phosphatase [Klenkia brasiliensis]SDF83604.1 Stage II sporulation protein E (SpoIIE) [Klenkia brasiliensis]
MHTDDDAVARRVLGPGPLTPVRQLFLDTDWSATAIGPPASWPASLQAAVSTAMNTGFGMLVMAGPELVMVYNDAYAPLMGELHPAMGRPLPEVWADEWPLLAPMVAAVQDEQVANYFVDFPLLSSRNGFPEQTWFTYSYSPLLDPDLGVVGVLDTVTETTDRVLAARRLGLAQALGQVSTTRHPDLDRAAAAVVEVLAAHRDDLPFAALHLLGDVADPGGPLRSVAVHGVDSADPGPAAQGWLRASLGGAPVEVHPLAGTGWAGVHASDGAGGGAVQGAVVLPLTPPGRGSPIGALALGLSPHLRHDDAYRTFWELVASQVAGILGDTLAHLAEQAAAAASRSMAEVLQRSLLTEPAAPDHLEVVVRYRPAVTEVEVGGDWYDAFRCPDGSTWLVVGDVAGHDQAAAATMGQVRNLLRGIAWSTQTSPAQALATLDTAIAGLGVGTLTSVVAARIEQDPELAGSGVRRLRWSNAGHPPPVLLHADGGAQPLTAPVDLILGADPGAGRRDHEVELRPGDGVLLYTDGLVERRDGDLDAGQDWLVAELAGRGDAPVARLCDDLLSRVEAHAEDDIALLALRAHPEDRPVPVTPR